MKLMATVVKTAPRLRGGLGVIRRKAYRQLGRREFGDLLRGAGREIDTHFPEVARVLDCRRGSKVLAEPERTDPGTEIEVGARIAGGDSLSRHPVVTAAAFKEQGAIIAENDRERGPDCRADNEVGADV